MGVGGAVDGVSRGGEADEDVGDLLDDEAVLVDGFGVVAGTFGV